MINTHLLLNKRAIDWVTTSYGATHSTLDCNEYGVWRVVGEDPNCDLGGHHHNPHIGYFEGYLHDVIDLAVEQKDFFVWGAGGEITRHAQKIIKVNSKLNAERKKLLEEKAAIEKRLKEINGEVL